MRLLQLLTLILVTMPCPGTVNLFLSDANGVAVLTDSALSNSGKRLGEGQKLFQIDGHTLCTIAGSYAFPRPSQDPKRRPFYSAVPNLINSMVANHLFSDSMPLETKLTAIANAVAFTISLDQEISQAEHLPDQGSETFLTMVAYEAGRYRLGQIVISRSHLAGSPYPYTPSKVVVANLGPEFSYKLAGITSTAESILTNPDQVKGGGSAIEFYKEQRSTAGLRNMSLSDLEHLGRRLIYYTGLRFPAEVGGATQIAEVSREGASMSEPYAGPQYGLDIIPYRFAVVKWKDVSLPSPMRLVNVVSWSAPVATAIFGMHAKNLVQDLDRSLIFGLLCEHCTLVYNGSEDFYLDPSNTFTDSTLLLQRGVDPLRPAVQGVLKQFPGLKLVRTDGGPPKSQTPERQFRQEHPSK